LKSAIPAREAPTKFANVRLTKPNLPARRTRSAAKPPILLTTSRFVSRSKAGIPHSCNRSNHLVPIGITPCLCHSTGVSATACSFKLPIRSRAISPVTLSLRSAPTAANPTVIRTIPSSAMVRTISFARTVQQLYLSVPRTKEFALVQRPDSGWLDGRRSRHLPIWTSAHSLV